MTILDYSAKLPKKFKYIWVIALLLAIAAFPWSVVLSITFYFLAPNNWHYIVFDYRLAAFVLFFVLTLPAIIATIICIQVLRPARRAQFSDLAVAMSWLSLLVSIADILWLFWGIVISPASPYEPGYWL